VYGILHLCPPNSLRATAAIVGDRVGLRRLLHAIERALDDGAWSPHLPHRVMSTDGEAVTLAVTMVDEDGLATVPSQYADRDPRWTDWLIRHLHGVGGRG